MSNKPETRGAARSQAGAKVQFERSLVRSMSIGRLNDAEEVAHVALFLASDRASSMQATETVIAGGASRAPQGALAYHV